MKRDVNPTVSKIAQLNVNDNPKVIAEKSMISLLTVALIQKWKFQNLIFLPLNFSNKETNLTSLAPKSMKKYWI